MQIRLGFILPVLNLVLLLSYWLSYNMEPYVFAFTLLGLSFVSFIIILMLGIKLYSQHKYLLSINVVIFIAINIVAYAYLSQISWA